MDETGNLLIIRGSIDSKEYSVPKNTVINVDKSSDKIVLYMTRDDSSILKSLGGIWLEVLYHTFAVAFLIAKLCIGL